MEFTSPYDSPDEDEFEKVTGMPPNPSLSAATATSMKALVASQLVIGQEDFFRVGLVFVSVESKAGREEVRLWIVAGKSRHRYWCVRIRTYKGEGIKHLAARRLQIQSLVQVESLRATQLNEVQKDIDAHTIVFPKKFRPARRDPDEPFMVKKSLGVVLDDGVGHQVIRQMCRACFTCLAPRKYGEQVARVGQLDKRSSHSLYWYTCALQLERS